jgi:glycosyltransferase involved in cell wall biosynthesis
VGGIPELIEDGVNGVLVENTPESVAAALRNIDAALGVAARHTVEQRFTEDKMIEATLQAYRQVLNRA